MLTHDSAKAAKIRQLIDSRTWLLDALAGLCDEDFDRSIGASCQSLRARLAGIAAIDWEVATFVRQLTCGGTGVILDWSADAGEKPPASDLIERRRCCSSTEVVAEVVLSLQALLAELRPLSEQHFVTTHGSDEVQASSVPRVLDALLRDTEQHFEEIQSWLSQ
jgi:hypothetical protein